MTAINLKASILILAISSLTNFLFSQNIEFRNSNFKSDKAGLKIALKNIKIADDFRTQAVLNFLSMQDAFIESESALYYYNKAQNFNPNNADLNYKIASVLLFTNRKELAKKYLDKAISLSKDLPLEHHFFQGMVWQLEGQYAKAIKSYKRAQEIYPAMQSPKIMINQIEQLIKQKLI